MPSGKRTGPNLQKQTMLSHILNFRNDLSEEEEWKRERVKEDKELSLLMKHFKEVSIRKTNSLSWGAQTYGGWLHIYNGGHWTTYRTWLQIICSFSLESCMLCQRFVRKEIPGNVFHFKTSKVSLMNTLRKYPHRDIWLFREEADARVLKGRLWLSGLLMKLRSIVDSVLVVKRWTRWFGWGSFMLFMHSLQRRFKVHALGGILCMLWGILYGVPALLLWAVWTLYSCSERCVCILGRMSSAGVDVRQCQRCALLQIQFAHFHGQNLAAELKCAESQMMAWRLQLSPNSRAAPSKDCSQEGHRSCHLATTRVGMVTLEMW